MSKKAIRLIEKCIADKNTVLDLGYSGLWDDDFVEGGILDTAISECTHIHTLILSNEWWDPQINELIESPNWGIKNYFEVYPSSFLKLKQLQIIICSGGRNNDSWGISDLSFISTYKNLRHLDFSYNKIEKIEGLDDMTSLEYLQLNNNQIKELSGVENLVSLKKLFLSNNKIEHITALKNLYSLIELLLSGNQIREIKGLEGLKSLYRLFIYSNQIKEIKGLENLNSLQQLYIYNNQIKEIKGLENLKSLQQLHIHSNQIREIKGLENLINLRKLDLSYNRIQKLAGLENLDCLTLLDLSSNEISDIEPLLPFIKKKNTDRLNISLGEKVKFYEINLYNNPIVSPPIEVVMQGKKAILNFFSESEDQGTEYLYEAKMLIVGQPRAGKTSLMNKLIDINRPLSGEYKTTKGIDIEYVNFDVVDKENNIRKFQYNIWDFGGQHIYQTTHQFFLTHRSLYVLVIDTGKDSIGNDDNTVNYWLQAVELLGGNSPMLLVRNEKNERQINIDIPQKRARFEFLKGDYGIDLNALIKGSPDFSDTRFNVFQNLKEDIQTQLKRLPLVGFPMPKNWVAIRYELQELSLSNHYINQDRFIELCKQYHVTDFDRQMELSRIFHDLGIFLHFQEHSTLEDFIILQNTWATDAVFAVFDNKQVQTNKGRFTSSDLSGIWKDKEYDGIVHKKLLNLMIQFELCYMIDKSNPHVYIIPEMLSDTRPEGGEWKIKNDLPLQYKYDFMPRGILTRFIVRMHKYISRINDLQFVWKTGVRIEGKNLDCGSTIAEITEAWDNKRLDIKVQGPYAKELLSKITFQFDELNNEYFRQVSKDHDSQKSRWYKMIPCNCISCADNADKHFYDYQKLLERKEYGRTKIECERKPFAEVNIEELLSGVFADKKEQEASSQKREDQTITIFLASSSELKTEREQFELFLSRENKRLSKKGIFLNLEIWEDFLDHMSQTRLQDEYNKVIKGCDVFIMLYFSKVGKYTAEEFETAFKQFREADKPKIYTYFKKADVNNASINRDDLKSVWAFQDKLKELGHFQTEFDSDAQLHLHFKKQLERLYDI
ncbi:COR domain-containing protein [Mucilaginibacter sp. OK283]|uniref:COR domain-containing protein n=1 Tax=Mucilaginibacter sp. OK283 TaxID=1881049 RepID=UPI0008B41D94|nr:COR domain-containing protein [Mucilaginibacter sp. OK283]SEO19091.1 Leucine Rich repeat-containing protein [Mucilaginibacter sp. OK283]